MKVQFYTYGKTVNLGALYERMIYWAEVKRVNLLYLYDRHLLITDDADGDHQNEGQHKE